MGVRIDDDRRRGSSYSITVVSTKVVVDSLSCNSVRDYCLRGKTSVVSTTDIDELGFGFDDCHCSVGVVTSVPRKCSWDSFPMYRVSVMYPDISCTGGRWTDFDDNVFSLDGRGRRPVSCRLREGWVHKKVPGPLVGWGRMVSVTDLRGGLPDSWLCQ